MILKMQPALTNCACLLRPVSWGDRQLSDDPEADKDYIDVSGRIAGDDAHYTIEYTPWAEWLSMSIELDSTVQGMPDVETLAHILREMTWAGFDEATIKASFNQSKTPLMKQSLLLASEAKEPRN